MKVPKNLSYTKDHEWALIKDTTVIVGITDYAQDQLGDIVYIELPPVGTKVEKGKEFGVVESVKAVSELYSPVSGEIIKINDSLKNSCETINRDPYDKGWMIHIKMRHPQELQELLNKTQYEELIHS